MDIVHDMYLQYKYYLGVIVFNHVLGFGTVDQQGGHCER